MTTLLIWKYCPKSEDKGNYIALATVLDILILAFFTL